MNLANVRMRRICMVRHAYYSTAVRVRREANALRERGYEIDLICLKKKGEKIRETINGINIHRLPIQRLRGSRLRYILEYSSFFLLAFIKVSFLYLRRNYDLIQVNTLPDFLVFVALLSKICGAKVVLDMQEAMPEFYSCNYRVSEDNLVIKIIEGIEKMSTRFADRIITVHEPLKEVFVGRGVPTSKITVVLNSSDEKIFNSAARQSEDATSKRKFVLMSHGTIVKRYGLDTAIRAIAQLKDKIPDIQLNVVGDGEYLPVLRELVSQLRLEKHVRFSGRWLDLDEIPRMIRAADVGLVPVVKSKYTDLMLSEKFFEYIAMKKPVIISRIKAVETYFGENAGVFFESENEKDLAHCILELYRNPAKRKSLVRKASKVYEKYRWANMKKEYLRVYEHLMEGKSWHARQNN